MRKIFLAAALAAMPLSGCATIGTPPSLEQTTIDEKALTTAYASFDVLLTAIDGLVVAGVLKPGTPRALQVQSLIRTAQNGLNIARTVHGVASIAGLEQATGAFRSIAAILKGN